MNKKILGASAAATVLAAMPLLGVFAADSTTVTDTVSVNIDATCTLGVASTGASPSEPIVNGGNNQDMKGSEFSVTCNASNGWHITAKGAGEEGHETDLITSDKAHTIETGTTLDGSVSNWAFKATGTGVETTYQDFAAVPSEAKTIAKGSAPVSGNKISITYGAGVSATQDAGTYTGKVTYTLAQGQE